jgi:DHA2 family multidrug resistance protein
VVLDKGQRDDWFESNFIVSFLAVALTALAAGIWWELRHKEPVVDLTLLRERNFALANFFYFMFGFVLIGSTVLIPQMLQGLFGYTAYQSGWAISPAAFVVVCMAPLVVKFIFPAFGAARLIGGSFLLQAAALWYYSGLDLGADYNSFIVARLIQGFGIAFLFIPVSALAYSYLPKELNNKASSLTNLFRNLGSSFGISFVTTLEARREQVHQTFLVEHLSTGDPTVMARLQAYSMQMMHGGYTAQDAKLHAEALLAQNVADQAKMLAFLDVFWVLAWFSVASAALAFFIRPFDSRGGPPGE